MQAAWDQLGQVLEANRRIRAAQVARELTFVYHRVSWSRCGWPPGALCSSSAGRCSPGWSRTPTPPPRSARPRRPRRRDHGRRQRRAIGAGPPPPTVATVLADSLVARTPRPRLCAARPGRAPRSRGAAARGRPGRGRRRRVDADRRDRGPARAARAAGPDERRRSSPPRRRSGRPKASSPSTSSSRRWPGRSSRRRPSSPRRTPAPRHIPTPSAPCRQRGLRRLPARARACTPPRRRRTAPRRCGSSRRSTTTYTAFNAAIDAGAVPPRTSHGLRRRRGGDDGRPRTPTSPCRAARCGGIALPEPVARPEPPTPPRRPSRWPPAPIAARRRAAVRTAPDPLGEVMAYPVIDLPMFRPLADLSPDLFCPNVNLVAAEQHHAAGDEPPVHRVLPGRAQPRDGPRAAVAGVPDRPARQRRSGSSGTSRRCCRCPARPPSSAASGCATSPPIHTWDTASHLGDHDNRGASGRASSCS